MKLSRRGFMKYASVTTASLLGVNLLGCSSRQSTGGTEIGKLSTVVMGYGKDHNLKGGKWGIGFFPKVNTLEKLVEYDLERDEYRPFLAERWEVENGGKSITFVLKKGIKFSDGNELTADAVKFYSSLARKQPSSRQGHLRISRCG